MLLPILLAFAIPISFLYALHWLDLYGTDRPRIVLQCFGWGLVAFALSFLTNRFCIDILGLTRAFVSTRTAPFVEELFKAGILVYLMRRGRISYFVDGAIYGFACGIGFAAIENVRYIQLFPDNPFGLIIVRDFSSALAHGTATAMTGIALGSFVLSTRRNHRAVALLLGLSGAMTLHYLWNNFAYFSPLGKLVTEWILVGVGLTGSALVATTILWGLRRERAQLQHALGLKVGVSDEEANVVQHLDDLDELLGPIERRFGTDKRRQVEDFLHLEARLGLKEDLAEKTEDPAFRAALATEIAELERELDQQRRHVGVYVMLYVRSIFPATDWSLWARLAQTVGRMPAMRTRQWDALRGRLTGRAAPGEGLYARIQAEVDARVRAASLSLQHVDELPEAMQKCMHWVMRELHVTVEHVAAGIGHHEVHVHEMLVELTNRGFLHHAPKDGQPAFRARALPDDPSATKSHVWHSAARRKTTKART
jgi:RsiW-degrading membrane proteinase PrsW (M82 family)